MTFAFGFQEIEDAKPCDDPTKIEVKADKSGVRSGQVPENGGLLTNS